MSLQPKRCLLAYHSTSNAFLRDLPVSSFMFHSSLLTVKSIDLVVTHDGFLCTTEMVHIFHSGYLDYRGVFQIVFDSFCCVTSWTQRRAMDTLFQMITDFWSQHSISFQFSCHYCSMVLAIKVHSYNKRYGLSSHEA